MTGSSLGGLTAPVRAFVALPCPEELRRSVAAGVAQWRDLDADIAWVDPKRIHLTLRFLGDADPASLVRLDAELHETARGEPPVTARAGSTGAFPGRGRPRVLWLGLESGGGVERLAEAVENAARASGFDPETRPFTPHFTLGRVRGPRGSRRAIAAVRHWEPDRRALRLGELVLYRSRLGPEGARHDALAVYPLGRPDR